jgi:hypothetical protein
MAELKNTFIQGVMNKDLDERLVPQGQYRDAQNITVETSTGSNVGAAQNSLGNTIAANIAAISGRDATDARTIGSVTYEAGGLLYWFVAGDFFDGIYEYDENTGTTVRVLQSNKPNESTPSKLNFKKEYLITGVNHIIGPDGNTFLYWTDDYNPPRRINIKRVKAGANGIGGYNIDDARIDSDIDVILNPPMYAPHIELITDAPVSILSNNMEEKFLYFAYRYLYLDNQYSSLSPFSAVAFMPDEYDFDYGVGNNKSMTNIYNECRVSFETGNEFVKAIQLVVRDTRSINVGIIETYEKDNLPGFTNGDSVSVTFTNNKVLAALPTDQVTRLFDNVPLLAKAQDVIGNRLAYGNYEQFRDIIDCNGDNININFALAIKQPTLLPTVLNPMSTWRSDRDLEFALLYSDEYGRLTTALTCDTNAIYIPPANSTSANQLLLRINHTAPCWATNYRIAVKQGQSKVYNVFPILYYVSGAYRYFLINDSDVDKVKVGEYIIFKSDPDGPTQSNKKYKILELDSKNTGAIISGSIPGVYFKIKVDSLSEFSPSVITDVTIESTGWGAAADLQPVYSRADIIETPIHYGDGDPSALQRASIGTLISATPDTRFTVEILNNNQFRYTRSLDGSGPWSAAANIVQGSTVTLNRDGIPTAQVIFTQSNYTTGDVWKVNVRGYNSFNGNYFGGVGLPNGNYDPGQYGGGAVVNIGFTDPIQPGAVIRLQVIEDSLNPVQQDPIQQFLPSSSYYENIEEWFVESGAYLQFNQYDTNGINVKSRGVTFRRGESVGTSTDSPDGNTQQRIQQSSVQSDPMYMIIQGFGYDDNNDENKIRVKFSIAQNDTPLLCETSPKNTDAEIFHELSQTYPIDGNGNHIVLWRYEDFQFYSDPTGTYTKLVLLDKSRPHYFTVGNSVYVASEDDANFPSGDYIVLQTPDRYTVVLDTPWVGSGPTTGGTIKLTGSLNQDQNVTGFLDDAVIELNTPDNPNCDYNAWAWGNGLESDRIYDDFNQTTIEYSPRATTVIDNYKKIRNDASICYSGIYNENTQYNRLNEFNLSLANFKYLDREFASIKKLHARDTDLRVFQEKKVSRVLYGKNVLFDSVGGGQVASIPEVLGNQIPMQYEYGISNAPESFSTWGDLMWFADPRNGVVIQMEGDTMVEVSSLGMKDYFRDLMRDNPFTQKLGAYDPFNHVYMISNNSQRSIPCRLSISRNSLSVSKDNLGYLLFSINTDFPWTITAVNIGFGTNWIGNFATSGSGSQNIYGTVAANNTSINRKVELRVTYCDGLTESFILTQARGRKGTIITLVLNAETPKK